MLPFPQAEPTMNGSLYEETSNSRSSVEVVPPPLHIPAKRALAVSAYECSAVGQADTPPGVIRHGPPPPHNAWASPYDNNHSAFDPHQYGTATGQSGGQSLCNSTAGYYYNERKPQIKFWSNSYELPGPSVTTSADTCQSFAPQSWCNYAPYSGRHMDHHGGPQPVTYLAEERARAPMDGFAHTDGYTLRTFSTAESHPQPTYVPAGTGEFCIYI